MHIGRSSIVGAPVQRLDWRADEALNNPPELKHPVQVEGMLAEYQGTRHFVGQKTCKDLRNVDARLYVVNQR